MHGGQKPGDESGPYAYDNYDPDYGPGTNLPGIEFGGGLAHAHDPGKNYQFNDDFGYINGGMGAWHTPDGSTRYGGAWASPRRL
jgi:hypothetical protein